MTPAFRADQVGRVKVTFSYIEFKANQHEISSIIKSDNEPRSQQEEEKEERTGQEEEASAPGSA